MYCIPTRSLHFLSCFNSHFPREPGLAGVYWSKGRRKWWWQLDLQAQLQSSHHHQQTNTQFFFTDQMPFLSPNQQCQSTEGKIPHSMDLLTSNSPGGLPTLSLTTNSSWLPWGGLPCLSSALWCQYPCCILISGRSHKNAMNSALLYYYYYYCVSYVRPLLQWTENSHKCANESNML